VKQRTDNQSSKFLVPRGSTGKTNWAEILETYLAKVQDDLQKFSGRVFWTGRSSILVKQPLA